MVLFLNSLSYVDDIVNFLSFIFFFNATPCNKYKQVVNDSFNHKHIFFLQT